MKVTLIATAVIGAIWGVGHLVLCAVAFSDAHSRCPGNQCSDALSSGADYLASAVIGLLLVTLSVACVRTWSARIATP